MVVRPPVAPMLAKLSRSLPDGDVLYEPKWDGFRTLAFRDGASVDLRSRNDKRLARYFPEIVDAVASLPMRSGVVDGEIVVVGDRGLDFASLMARLHPAASRVERLRVETPAVFVAFDALAVDDDDLRAAPFGERRARLERLFASSSSPHVLVTPSTTDRALAEAWLGRRAAGVDGVVVKPRSMPYAPGKRVMTKVKEERTLDAVLAGMRVAPGPRVGSLLLGLRRGDALVHVGVVSQLTEAARASLLQDLRPLVVPLRGHPWEHGFGLSPSPLGRLAGSAGRWSPDEMDRDWVPLAPSRVVEVSYHTIDDGRLRFPAKLVRFRPDRDASSCGFDQIPEPELDVRRLLGAA